MRAYLLALAALFFLGSASASYLITSAGRDFPTAYSIAQGSWHYEARWNNGSTQPLIYRQISPAITYWIDNTVSSDGQISNSSTTFKALTGVTLFMQGGPDEVNRLSNYNATINWTSNVTATVNITGWYQNWGVPFNDPYNVSIYQNGQLIYGDDVGGADATNYSYSSVVTPVSKGDFIAFSIGANSLGAGSEDAAVNATMFIIDLTSSLAITANTPADGANNVSIIQPFSFTPVLVNTSEYGFINASIFTNASGWLPTGNTSAVANNTLNWVNVTFPQYGQYIWAAQVCSVIEGCKITANYTLTLLPPRLFIQVFNESASPTNLLYNLTISNGTNTTVYPTMTSIWFNRTWWEIPTGDLAITIANSTALYSTRTFYLRFNTTNMTLTAYLALESLVKELDITLQDYAGNKLSGYYVNAQRSFQGTDNYTTVAQVKTDYTGQGVMHIDITYPNYRFVAYTGGYAQVGVFVPVTITSDDLIATDTYAKIFVINQQSTGLPGQGTITSATCGFATATAVLTCAVSGYGQTSNLTVENLTASGFQQICSDSTTPAEGTLTCTLAGYNGSLMKYYVYIENYDGTRFLATSGVLDYTNRTLDWGLTGFILFIMLGIVLVGFGSHSPVDMGVMLILLMVAGKLLSVFDVGWEYVIGMSAILLFIVKSE